MVRRGDGLVEVVLVEDGGAVNDGVRRVPGPWIGRRIGTWWSTRPARLRSGVARFGAAVAAVLCVAVVLQQGTGAAAEAALAALPGRSVSLAGALHEVWHRAGSPIGWVDGDLLVSDGAAATIQRVDPTTGAVRWSTTTGGECLPLESVVWGVYPGGALQRFDGARLVCSTTGRSLSGDASEGGGIVVLDTADGTTSPGPHLEGSFLGLVPVGGDVVVVTATADGRVRAERWSPDSGRIVWSYAGTDRILDATHDYGVGADLSAVQVFTGTTTLRVDLETGRERSAVDDVPGPSSEQVYAVTESTLSDGSTVRGSIGEKWTFERTAADGTELPPLPGWPVAVGVEDGSGAGVAFAVTQDGTGVAVDLSTGSTRWSVPGQVVAVLGGLAVVVRMDGGSISALDLATGTEVWSAPVPQAQYFGLPVTDGRSVGFLTLLDPDTARAGSRLVLRVVDLRTGVERAQTRIPGYSASLIGTAPDGTVLVATSDGRLSGFRP